MSPFPVRRVERSAVNDYLSNGKRYTGRGITLYTKPTPETEVGFLIRGRAGKAVERVRTRRLFWGILNNGQLPLQPQLGYTFLFHRHFSRTKALLDALNKLVTRIQPL